MLPHRFGFPVFVAGGSRMFLLWFSEFGFLLVVVFSLLVILRSVFYSGFCLDCVGLLFAAALSLVCLRCVLDCDFGWC